MDTEKIIKILIARLKVIKITINTEKINLFTHTNASEKFFDLFYHGRRDTEKIIKILIARLKEIKYTGKKCKKKYSASIITYVKISCIKQKC